MVKLRLARFGKKHKPSYRLIAIEARTKRNGKAIEYLGYYNPMTNPSTFTYDKERVKYWLSKGAQPTDTVRSYLAKDKLVEPLKKKFHKKPGKKAQERAKKKQKKQEKSKKDPEKIIKNQEKKENKKIKQDQKDKTSNKGEKNNDNNNKKADLKNKEEKNSEKKNKDK